MVKNILIVDDSQTNLMLLELLLEKANCNVTAFTSPQFCLEWAQTNIQDVDLAILDYQMPELNGGELASALRTIGYREHLVILTAYHAMSMSMFSKEANISGIMNKPINIQDVTYMVKRWSTRSNTLDARQESRVECLESSHESIFLYRQGVFNTISGLRLNESEKGVCIGLAQEYPDAVKPADEIVLNNGQNYSVRWTRQHGGEYHFGASVIG